MRLVPLSASLRCIFVLLETSCIPTRADPREERAGAAGMADAVQVKLKQIFQRCCPRGGDNHVEIGSVENALRKMNLMADGEAKVRKSREGATAAD